MSPSDKNEAVNPDAKEESQSQESAKANGMDPFATESSSPLSSSSTSSSCTSNVTTPENSTITSIPLFTAKLSTWKCSDNDQMKTFDPGEASNNENTANKQCGYPLFPLKNSNSVAKNNKNYKAGSKINRLADMLAKRSQNIVEMTQNVTSEVIADIISAPKVESNVDISENAKSDDKLKMFCEKKLLHSRNESQNKSVPNSEILKKLDVEKFSDSCEETAVTELNALKEHLIKSETDGSTKKIEELNNQKNTQAPLILPEKKRRSSPRTKLVFSEVNLQTMSGVETFKGEESSATIFLEQIKSTSVNKKTEKSKSTKHKKSKKLVETSTQTSTTDFIDLGSKSNSTDCEAVQTSTVELVSPVKEDCEIHIKDNEENRKTAEENLDELDKGVHQEKSDITTLLSDKTEDDPQIELNETKSDMEHGECVYACMYCSESFMSREECKHHEKAHSQKKNKQNIKCQFCIRRFQSFSSLKSHCYKHHPFKYAYCPKCDERFCEKSQLYEHNKVTHFTKPVETAQTSVMIEETASIDSKEQNKEEIEELKKSIKPASAKSDLKVDVSFDTCKKPTTSPRSIQKVSPRESKPEEQLLEMEMLFYSNLSGNIQENLANHLDGKIDKNSQQGQSDSLKESTENDLAKAKGTSLLSVVTSDSSATPEPVARAPSPYQTRSKTPNPLPPTAKKFKKLPNWQQKFWEKYNFPTNYRYEHRFWDKNYFNTEKSPFHLKDLSCLDIKTQLIMRENIKKLDCLIGEGNNKTDRLSFPEYLALIPKTPDGNSVHVGECSAADTSSNINNSNNKEDKRSLKSATSDINKAKRKISVDNSRKGHEKNRNLDGTKMMTRRQSVIELKKNEDGGKKRKGSLDILDAPRMTLRRQTSLDGLQKIASEGCKNERVSNDVESNTDEMDTEENLSFSTGFAEISGEWVRPRSYLCGTCCAKFTNLWELEDHKWLNHPNVWCTHYEFEDEKINKLFSSTDAENAEKSTEMSKVKLTDLYKRYLLPHGSLKTAKLVPNMSFPEQCTKCNKNCMSLPEMHKHMLDCGGDTTWFLTMYSSPMSLKRRWRPFGSRRRKQIGRRVLKRNIPSTSNIRSYHYQHRIRTKPGDVESIQKMLANLPEKRARRAISFDKEIKTRSQGTIRSNRILRKRFKVSFGTNIMRLKALKQQKQAKVKKENSSKSTTDSSSENSPTSSPKRKNKQKDVQIPKVESITTEEIAKVETKKQSKKKDSPVRKDSDKKKDKTEKQKKLSAKADGGNIQNKKKKVQLKETETVKTESIDTGDGKLKKGKSSGNTNKKPILTPDKQTKKELANSPKGTPTKKKSKTDVEDDKVSDDILEIVNESKKGKKESPGKNILRLKSNEKEKTEIIKKIQKPLKNSKKILEEKEIKDQDDRRRSLRIQTLQLADGPNSNEELSSLDTEVEVKRARSPNVEKEPLAKKISKSVKVSKINDVTTVASTDSTPVRRSSRSSLGSDIKMDLSVVLEERKLIETFQDISFEANQSELANTIKRSPVNETLVNSETPDNSDHIRCEFESIEKPVRLQNSKNNDTQTNKSQCTPPSKETIRVSNELEMPILAKEEPSLIMRGRTTRKSESEIPVLMPYKNEEVVNKDHGAKSGKRKGVVTFKVVNKKQKSSEKLNPLKIVKETEMLREKESVSKIKEEYDSSKQKKRKRYDNYNQSPKGERPIPKISKVKKYFLGICPNEIDKGGDSKDESGSDSEPLILLVNQKKEKTPIPLAVPMLNDQDKKDELINEVNSTEVVKKETVKKEKVKPKKERKKKLLNPLSMKSDNNAVTEKECLFDNATVQPQVLESEVTNDLIENELNKQIKVKKSLKGLKMTVKLKETPLIVENSGVQEGTDQVVDQIETKEVTEIKTERRSRRVSKEVKATNEFVIDDPLILVDELWSELDSDSDGSKKRSKKSKKKTAKKKANDEKRESCVNLEELLRNFGESKNPKIETGPKKLSMKIKLDKKIETNADKRKRLEKHVSFENKSYRRLSLRLFKFNRQLRNFGNLGRKLLKKNELFTNEINSDVKAFSSLPFLAAEIKENPVQIIQCGIQKAKSKRNSRKSENKSMQLKISLPLQSISNLAVLNNNHLTDVTEMDMNKDVIAVANQKDTSIEEIVGPVSQKEDDPDSESKLKQRRSDVIDKIFYCELCKTYYYSLSQLRMHKLSNRHKLKESEIASLNEKLESEVSSETVIEDKIEPPVEKINEEVSVKPTSMEQEKLNDDTSEMPILEGPFIENPFVRLGMEPVEAPPVPSPPSSSMLGFTEECLKDIQNAIGCTDEEMLILTLLGENSIEIENDILDLDSCQPITSSATDSKTQHPEETKEKESNNGMFKLDFKKRITSALARLVNKAVLNLLQKYKSTHRTGISPEALSFLIKLSKVNDKKNLLELDELLKNESKGESSTKVFPNEDDKKEFNVPYKYLCTICDARFQKESTMEWHMIRSHRSKSVRDVEEVSEPVANEEDKEDEMQSYKHLCNVCGARFQKESIKECHIVKIHLNQISKSSEEPSSSPGINRDDDKKEQSAPYKYLCNICGSRFQKESMWECHVKRSHKTKPKKTVDEIQVVQTTYEDDWSNSWTYDINDELPASVETPQFLCSDCGINFTSPQEVLEHQKAEHAGPKDAERNECGPLQSSTIGSSDEIIKGKKAPRRGPKHLTKAELDQQMIIANNELKKLDRKFSNKSKSSKVKWGVDALKFTVEKENKVLPEPDVTTESPKQQIDAKNLDIVPKINLSRTSSVPEFKVMQKATGLNRFQRILDNKMKRKSVQIDSREIEEKEVDNAFVEPGVIMKKERKRKPNKCSMKKEGERKILDVYDFNDSESEPEPVAFSHVKRVGVSQSSTKLKLVKVKEVTETEKNKADSTTKDFETEDYDSEDSLPLSVVKRSRAEEEDEDIRDEPVDKPDGILEQVEYLIEQLENETINPNSKEKEVRENDSEKVDDNEDKLEKQEERTKSDVEFGEEVSVDSQPESFRVSLENKFLHLENIGMKKKDEELDETVYESQESLSSSDKPVDVRKEDEILPVADSSQGISDDDDSIPLVLMKADDTATKKIDEELSSSNIDFNNAEEEPEDEKMDKDIESPKTLMDSLESNINEDPLPDKAYETVNGNVIYRRNDSMSGFDSDASDYEQIESKQSPSPKPEENLIKEVMEKEDVVIVCSKKEQDKSKRKIKEPGKKKKQAETLQRRKKILPLLSVTLEEENFRKSESPKIKKDAIMKKIWSRRRHLDETTYDSDNSMASRDNEIFENSFNEDSYSEIDKEVIMNKIWNKKRLEHDETHKPEDIKINQTEISDEVVIQCGPKAKVAGKRRKSRNSQKESSKEKIMRKIWSGKCTFQTKAALKTYESDILHSSNETGDDQNRPKKRGRPAGLINSKKTKVLSDDDKSDMDDLDSLLEEIEREEVEKAIRLEFLQLRRSDKEVSKEGNMTIGLFAETCKKQGRDLADRRRKRIRKNVKDPEKHLLRRRKFIRKPIVKPRVVQVAEEKRSSGEDRLKDDAESLEAITENRKSFDLESRIRNRKHKKHRHKHHHHKHKHKKSKHKKYLIGKHKIKRKEDKADEFGNFSILEKMCQEIPNEIEKQSQKRFEMDNLGTKLDEILMSTSSSFDGKAKECEDVFYDGPRIEADRNYEIGSGNIYDFVDDESGFLCESKGRHKN